MLLLTGSAEFENVLPGWEHFPSTKLNPLTAKNARELLELFLTGLGELPSGFADKIIGSTDGSPGAIKAVVRYLREVGAIRSVKRSGKSGYSLDPSKLDTLELADDIESIMLARTARLPEQQRDLLALAAVAGKVFWVGAILALQRQADAPLSAPGTLLTDARPEQLANELQKLVDLRFVETRPSDINGEDCFAFRSDAYWEASYNLMPQSKREQLHEIVAQWLLLNVSHEPDAYLEQLAFHAEKAGHRCEAATYLLKAARVSQALYRTNETRQLLEKARELVTEKQAQTFADVHLDLGAAQERDGDLSKALECYQTVLQFAWRFRNRRLGALALTRIGGVESDRGNYESAHNHIHRALQLYQAIGEPIGIAEACSHLGRMYRLRGAFDDALKAYAQAETNFTNMRHDSGVAATLHAVGAVYAEQGKLNLAEQHYHRALEIRRENENAKAIATTLNDLGCIFMMQGRTEESLPLWEEGSHLASSLGERAMEATLRDSYGEGLLNLGRPDEARKQLDEARQIARSVGHLRVQVHSCLNLCRALLQLSDTSGADEVLEEARKLGNQLDLPLITGLVQRARAELDFAKLLASESGVGGGKDGTLVQIADSYRQAVQVLEANGYRTEAAQTRDQLADVLTRANLDDQAAEERRIARELREQPAG